MSSNFDFLQREWQGLHKKILKAEARVYTESNSSGTYCRLVMEECVNLIYEREGLELPFNDSLASLMQESDFKSLLPWEIYNGLHVARKFGNDCAHFSKKVQGSDALISIKHMFTFLKWFALNYSNEEPVLPGRFDEQVIPKVGEEGRKLRELESEYKKVQAELEREIEALKQRHGEALERAKESEASLFAFQSRQEASRAALKHQKSERRQKVSSEFTEAETRKHLIDMSLREAGWKELRPGRELEYPVKGMPVTTRNPKGNGFADYVLWDDNGLPLAVIEAKRTGAGVEEGRHQASLYADCLEHMHGQRPVIFYTNGYETYIWDDAFYSAPRRVYGFYSKEELQWTVQKRESRKDIRLAQVNGVIAGRPYQMEAIQRVCEAFVTDSVGSRQLKGGKRNALLAMATGSGKTRTIAAMAEVLFRHGWVKRVLFLADRNALVSQAKKRFSEFLPELSAIDLTQEKENDTTRLVFSTFPSMMNKIDSTRNGDERFYGTGHFDLIIVDEAHRSVYNKFGAIFAYFDALIVGLTATPKDQIDHNTFELFGCSKDDPTYEYSLDEAVKAGYLVPYRNLSVTTQFLREGIKYSQLSPAEKEEYEKTFVDSVTGFFPEEIGNSALNKWLFNKDTANKVLDALMQEGLKIEGGDKLGRTIIFAVNHKHAEFILKCFVERYPQYPPGFVAVIHNQVSHSESLIEAFCEEHQERMPQVAISVDMMDTGIDAPRVLNLVFFKVVRSYAKFWQMIGRGTRLCKDVFGPNQPKEYFLIFDVCGNFEFFDVETKGKEGGQSKPLAQQLFETRLHLSQLLLDDGSPEHVILAGKHLDALHAEINTLDMRRFEVSMKVQYVDRFKDRDRWNNLCNSDIHDIEEHLAMLPVAESTDESARRFDLLTLKYQVAKLMEQAVVSSFAAGLMDLAELLSKKYSIPAVTRSQPLIEAMKEPEFFDDVKQQTLEQVREEIRELIKYLDASAREPVYTDFEDSEVDLIGLEPDTQYLSEVYRKRVERFIRENIHHVTIRKLNTNQPITKADLDELEKILFDGEDRGTKENFMRAFGDKPLGGFIRSIVGLDANTAQGLFADFLQAGNLRADQIKFIQSIITHLTKNGTIDKNMLFESPFTDINDDGLFGLFDDGTVAKVISIIEYVNRNVDVA